MFVPIVVLMVSYTYTRFFSQYMHLLGILSILSCFFLVGSIFGETPVQRKNQAHLTRINVYSLLFFVSAFHTHMNIPVVIKNSKYKVETHQKAITIAFLISFSLYLSVGIFSYSKFGITNDENILVRFSDSIVIRFIGSICPFARAR